MLRLENRSLKKMKKTLPVRHPISAAVLRYLWTVCERVSISNCELALILISMRYNYYILNGNAKMLKKVRVR
jgi:hypothetical protein